MTVGTCVPSSIQLACTVCAQSKIYLQMQLSQFRIVWQLRKQIVFVMFSSTGFQKLGIILFNKDSDAQLCYVGLPTVSTETLICQNSWRWPLWNSTLRAHLHFFLGGGGIFFVILFDMAHVSSVLNSDLACFLIAAKRTTNNIVPVRPLYFAKLTEREIINANNFAIAMKPWCGVDMILWFCSNMYSWRFVFFRNTSD